MPQVKATSTFGNYRWTASANITDKQAQILQDLGFLWVMQRTPSTRAEKVMAEYEKRPEGFKRSSIEYTDEGAKTLSEQLGEAVEIADGVSITPEITNVKFHEIGAQKEPQYADEKKVVARHAEAGTLDKLASKVGYTGDGNLDVENVDFLRSIKAFKAALLAKSL